MYKSDYDPVPGLPLTETIPLLLNWKGVSPYQIESQTNGDIKQATIHRICTGETKNPKLPVVKKIAQFFELSFAQIYDVDIVKKVISGQAFTAEKGQVYDEIEKRIVTLSPTQKELFTVLEKVTKMEDRDVQRFIRLCRAYIE